MTRGLMSMRKATAAERKVPSTMLDLTLPSFVQAFIVTLSSISLMEFMRRSFERNFTSEEVLQLLDRFYNLEMLNSIDGLAMEVLLVEGFYIEKKD
ncbi:hypothetical protein CK203_085783 [Vitis vinifera]|uniref:Uncharacterized protein n=1 Tax=Vitis vinifera TaxID=29760 RepID=A0A438E337_VITVI|nr:hypothetical protein CK203_085783 [Vitis vinifera]